MLCAVARNGVLVTAILAGGTTAAQNYPVKPIRLVIVSAPGGTTDAIARAFGQRLSERLGQPVIVDNKPGGSATLGPATMAGTAKPDGYTIGQIAIPVFRVPYMQKATFDPVKDFTYIILLGGYNLGAVVKADGPFKKWQDVIDFAKANPGKFTYTTIGAATTNAIAMELMARQSGVQFTHVPSKGGGESLAAILGDHIMMMVESPVWGSPLICDGKVYQGCENGLVKIYEVAKQAKLIAEHDMGSPVYSTPVYANGTLYVMTRDKLYAISDKK